jgi:hypothetical protein
VIGVFCDFSFGIIFQQVSLRVVTHCAGGFGVGFGFVVGCKRYRPVTVMPFNTSAKIYIIWALIICSLNCYIERKVFCFAR